MRWIFAIAAFAALTLPAVAAAELRVGVTDDLGRGAPDGGIAFLSSLNELGFSENRVSIVWDPDAPRTLAEQLNFERYVANAALTGIRIVVAVYPARPTAVSDTPDGAAKFAAFVGTLAQTYPQVTDFIVGNEPNQPRFWRPQYANNGAPVACASYEATLAASYDVLKAVNPAITVIGVGLSPRGNDNPFAPVNSSTSPVRCLRDIGAAYRASRRTKPIMDELAFHAYPEQDTQPFGVTYAWPRAGLMDLARIKQAVWDAFNGTAQPTFDERGRSVFLPALRLRVAEVGWQVGVLPSAQSAYIGTENVSTTNEASQANAYTQAIRLLECDPSVNSLLFFGLQDESDLSRWQAGLVRADGTRRPSYDAVKAALGISHGACTRTPSSWAHVTKVIGASARFPKPRTILPARSKHWSFAAGAKEDARFTAGLFRLARRPAAPQWKALIGRSLSAARSSSLKPALRLTGRVKAPWGRQITFPQRRLKPGFYVYAIRLAAEMNPARATVVMSKPFRIGSIGRKTKSGRTTKTRAR
jgi:hypothetical protein